MPPLKDTPRTVTQKMEVNSENSFKMGIVINSTPSTFETQVKCKHGEARMDCQTSLQIYTATSSTQSHA